MGDFQHKRGPSEGFPGQREREEINILFMLSNPPCLLQHSVTTYHILYRVKFLVKLPTEKVLLSSNKPGIKTWDKFFYKHKQFKDFLTRMEPFFLCTYMYATKLKNRCELAETFPCAKHLKMSIQPVHYSSQRVYQSCRFLQNNFKRCPASMLFLSKGLPIPPFPPK